MEDPSPRAFVLMPFEPEFDAVYAHHIKVPLEGAGFSVNRADSLMNQQNILKDIVRQIDQSDLVVADLTAENPNVFYELGIAHALTRNTVLITQSIEDVPFDLKSYRVIHYSTRFDQIGKLSAALKEIAQGAISHSIVFGNPVSDFLDTGNRSAIPLETHQLAPTVDTQQHAEEQPEEQEEEKGLWDYAMGSETGLVKATEVLNRFTELMLVVANKMKKRTEDVQAVQEQGGPGSVTKMFRIAELTASEILEFAREVDLLLPEFRQAWDGFSENITQMIRTTPIRTPEDKAAATQFSDSLANLATQISGGIEMLAALRDSQAQMRGISKSMNRAARRSSTSLDQLLAEFEKALASTSKVNDLMREILSNT
jgi:hypothetical protein